MTEPGEYVLTAKTVSHHEHANSAWVLVDGRVYDVTLFMESHPGGAEVFKGHLGKDVSHLMHGEVAEGSDEVTQHVHMHSAYAFKLLEKYYVGSLADVDASGKQVLDGNIDPVTGKELVDWSKPILPQIGELGDKYFTWIHSFPTSDHTVKMFQNDVIESLTKCPWYVPLLFWIPIILSVLTYYFSTVTIDVPTFSSLFITGYLGWLLFEYSLHRFVFHMKTTGYWSNILHFLLHGHHHITPMDFDRLVFPPAPALLVGGPIWAAFPQIFGFRTAYPILFGFIIGYLIYDMTHFYIHYGIPKSFFIKSQKSRHVHHHYLQPDVNFGISNPLFDYVFRTSYES